MSQRLKRICIIAVFILLLTAIFAPTVFAADTGKVSGAIEQTWKTSAEEIKSITNKVIFPIIDCVLAILLFVNLAMSYFAYKKHGEFEFTPVAILFFGLVFAMTAPLYIWGIIGL